MVLCVGCEGPVSLTSREAVAGYCSKRCYMHHYHARRVASRRATDSPRVFVCPTCAASWSKVPGFSIRVYCSDSCRIARRQQSLRKASRTLTCACGVEFDSVRKGAKFCSRRCCQRAYQNSATEVCATEGCGRPKRARGLCSVYYNKSRRDAGLDPQPWNDKKRDRYHRRRAQKKATADDRPVLLSEIRERDGNRCHLCCKKVSAKPYPHPLSASLDHIVPLSLDGEHVPENVRLAHLVCNTAKGNRGGNEQLLLIG